MALREESPPRKNHHRGDGCGDGGGGRAKKIIHHHPRPRQPKNRRIPTTARRDDKGGTKDPYGAQAIYVRTSRELEASLKANAWMPSPEDAGERQRRHALHVLERTLCQWSSNLEASSPATAENRWQRPRGE